MQARKRAGPDDRRNGGEDDDGGNEVRVNVDRLVVDGKERPDEERVRLDGEKAVSALDVLVVLPLCRLRKVEGEGTGGREEWKRERPSREG